MAQRFELRSAEPKGRDLLSLHGFVVPLKQIEYGVYGDISIIYHPKPYSIYLRGSVGFGRVQAGA